MVICSCWIASRNTREETKERAVLARSFVLFEKLRLVVTAAITAATAATWATIAARSAPATAASAMPASATATATAVPSTATTAAWTIRASAAGADGFSIGVFAIEIGLWFVIRKIAATFECDGFFGLRVRSRCPLASIAGCGSALAITAGSRHFGALLFQDRLA